MIRYFALPVLLVAVFSLAACSSTEQVFVARTDVPEDPTIVVVPANNQLYQNHFANEVEERVIEAGLSVIRRPTVSTKEVTQEAELARVRGGDQATEQTAEITQTYTGFGETDADYILNTFAWTEQVRVIESSTQSVLASFDLVVETDPSASAVTTEPETPIRDALQEIGLPVKQQEEEE